LEEVKCEKESHISMHVAGEAKQRQSLGKSRRHSSCHTNEFFINLSAIEANLRTMQQRLGRKTRIMPIVKAFAYGTNPIVLARFLERKGIDIFGVSFINEGIVLRKAGIKASIFAINGFANEAKKAVEWGLQIGISDLSLAKALASEAVHERKIVKVHLNVNTGMNRLGCCPQEALKLAEWISASKGLRLEGIMTHFACAENPLEDVFTNRQVKLFDEVITTIESRGIEIPWKHAANSSAATRFFFPQYNMARIGLALFGLASSNAVKISLELTPALTLQSWIAGIHNCKKGETVSYGRHYTIEKETQTIAVLPIGYFDGIHRHFSGKGYVLVRGQKASMVGSICMDSLMVDVSGIENVTLGEPVILFGEDNQGNQLPAEELAAHGNSIVHELITCLGPRIERVFIYEEESKP